MTHTRLKKFLFEHGIRQTRLAEMTGNTAAYISGLCLGRFTPRIEKAADIVAALKLITGEDVTLGDFWGQESDDHMTITPEASK